MPNILDSQGKIPHNTAIGLGQFEFIVSIRKKGISESMGTQDSNVDIWLNGNNGINLNYLEEPQDIYITSTNINDKQSFVVIGVIVNDAGLWELVPEIVRANGSTPKKLENQFLRIVRAYNNGIIPLQGNIYFSTAGDFELGVPDDTDQIQGFIAQAHGKTQMSHMTIPENYYGVLDYVKVCIANTQNTADLVAMVDMKIRKFRKTFITEDTFSVSLDGGSAPQIYDPGWRLDNKSDIKFSINKSSGNNTAISVLYGIRFYRNDVISTPYDPIPETQFG